MRNDKTFLEIYELLKTKKFNGLQEPINITDVKIKNVFKKSSKNNNNNVGFPDLSFLDGNNLFLFEIKNSKNKHEECIDDIKHYLNKFRNSDVALNIIGYAISGNSKDHYVDTFALKNNNLIDMSMNHIYEPKKYTKIFENTEINVQEISKVANIINNKIRDIDADDRSILLSCFMMSLYDQKNNIFRKIYNDYDSNDFIQNLKITVIKVLENAGVPFDKTQLIKNKINFLDEYNNNMYINVFKTILKLLEETVLPIMKVSTHYDIVGKFYEEFLKYAGITNVKKGIVLTPRHITELFTELIPIEIDDKILDPCCGTGAFLISGMNAIQEKIKNSTHHNKDELINRVKKDQLFGFEKKLSMYILSVSNMLFRGDGKSNIKNIDFFSAEATKIMKEVECDIGFINPPYSGKDTDKNPTKKEIQFIERMLDNINKWGIAIAPISTFFSDKTTRKQILKKHTISSIIKCPVDLFQPNATIATSIIVFQTNRAHNFLTDEIKYYDLKNDGLKLNKSFGRIDINNKWMSEKVKLKQGLKENKFKISEDDDWLLEAKIATNIKNLKWIQFVNKIINYKLHKSGIKANDIVQNNKFHKKITILEKEIDTSKFLKFDISEIFQTQSKGNGSIKMGGRLEDPNIIEGNAKWITATTKNNGIAKLIDTNESINNKGVKPHLYDFKDYVLTFNKFGNSFVQTGEIAIADSVGLLIPQETMGENILLYISTVLDLEQHRFSFGYSVTSKRFIKNIYLPAKNGKPDFSYMENFIKEIVQEK